MTNICVRGYLGPDLRFKTYVTFDHGAGADEVLLELARAHGRKMIEGKIDMIEIELLDDPQDPARFLRFGTNPDGMIAPVLVEVGEKP